MKPAIHKMRDGSTIPISQMTDSHLENTMMMLRRISIRGLTLRQGGGCFSEDMWYDQEILFGKEALSALGYKHYLNEWEKLNRS